MSLCWDESETYDVTGQLEKRILDSCEPIESTPQAAERMEPGNGAFHEPTENAQTAAVLGVAGGEFRLDA